MEIIHFSDLHLWTRRLGLDFYPRRFLGLANLWLNRARQFPPPVAERLLERLCGESADAVLFSGDLTTTSHPLEYERGRELFLPLMEKFGERFIAIAGNHDRYTPRVTREKYFERLFLRREQETVFYRSLNDKFAVLGMDFSFPQLLFARGRFSEQQYEQIKHHLQSARNNGQSVIVVCHYPVAYPAALAALERTADGHDLIDGGRLRALIDQPPVIAYLHGHLHQRWSVRLKHTVCVNAGSAGRRGRSPKNRPGYVQFELKDGAVKNLRAVTLQPPNFNEWKEQRLQIE